MKRKITGNNHPISRRVLSLVLIFLLATAFLFLPGAGADEIVYVTNSGSRYHADGCSSLSRSKIAVSLADAVKSGYGACSVCQPPVLEAPPHYTEDANKSTPALYYVHTAGLKNSGDADISRMLKAEVVGHVDGDTVRVRIPNPPEGLSVVETIRLLGVDTPETVHPNQPVQQFGMAASDFTKRELLNQNVYLAFDWDLRDRYGRLLAYIYTASGQCFNSHLIREGYGYAYLSYPFQFMEEFRALEQEARRESLGLWSGQ